MRTVAIPAAVLGLTLVAWMYLTTTLGFHRHPTLQHLFVPGAILIEVCVLVWALRASGRQGAAYGTLVKQGALIAVLAIVLIILGSLSLTTLAFPRFYDEVGVLDPERSGGTPLKGALLGGFMTVLTGVVASLVIAIFVRRRPDTA